MGAEGKRAIIFGSMSCGDGAFLRPYLEDGEWVVICADGGLRSARDAGLRPDYQIGDWDSGGAPEPGVPCVTLPVEKDMTDLQAAAEQALGMGCRELLLCGCTGGRLDHTASNLVLLEWIAGRGGRPLMVDEDNEVRFLEGPAELRLANRPPYRYLSLIPSGSHRHRGDPPGPEISPHRGHPHPGRHPVGEQRAPGPGDGDLPHRWPGAADPQPAKLNRNPLPPPAYTGTEPVAKGGGFFDATDQKVVGYGGPLRGGRGPAAPSGHPVLLRRGGLGGQPGQGLAQDISGGQGGLAMKIVVVKSPKALRGLLKAIFGIRGS